MRIVSIMAAILEDELREQGVLRLTQLDCEAMIQSMIERTVELEMEIKRHLLERHSGDGI